MCGVASHLWFGVRAYEDGMAKKGERGLLAAARAPSQAARDLLERDFPRPMIILD